MPRMNPSAADELRRLAVVNFVNFAGSVEVDEVVSQSWASITFSGERHQIRLRLEGPRAGEAADAFLDGLSEREFELRGHILADIALVSEERPSTQQVHLCLEALTVEAV